MTISVRRIDEREVDRVVPLFDAYRRFYGQPGDTARARAFLAERLLRNESAVLLAEREEEAVGFTQLYPMFSSVRTARVWVLNDLFVDSNARRGGVARRLLDAAVEFARGEGAARLMLETSIDNAPARALYRTAGWSEDASQWYSLDIVTGKA